MEKLTEPERGNQMQSNYISSDRVLVGLGLIWGTVCGPYFLLSGAIILLSLKRTMKPMVIIMNAAISEGYERYITNLSLWRMG